MKEKYEANSDARNSRDERSLIEKVARQHLFQSRDEKKLDTRHISRESIEPLEKAKSVLRAWKMKVADGRKTHEFGMIRIVSFESQALPEYFLKAFVTLLEHEQMPKEGLVIDIRSNPGGQIRSAELLLQTLTDRKITPMPFQFLANSTVEELIEPNKFYSKLAVKGWSERVTPSAEIGSMFSRFGPMSDPDELNATGRKYHGPIVLLTNAVTYSSGDIFAASFQDHKIGIILGVDANTGGGGANMWPLAALAKHSLPEKRFSTLPGGADMHVAIRRCTRLGEKEGLPIEESGVEPDRRHFLTKRDLLQYDADLMIKVGRILTAQNLSASADQSV